jgi:Uma2 family endonuclease
MEDSVMAVATLKYITEAEYLALEEKSEVKHEYYAGQIYAMAGGTPEHARICSSVSRELGNALLGGACGVYSSDLRIRVESTGLNTYPDASVVCGEIELTMDQPRAAVNPAVLVEVLSDSTRNYDHGEKWQHYKTIESLTDYLLVWQDRPCVEHYERQSRNAWTYTVLEGLDQSVRLHHLSIEIPLSGLYVGIVFSPHQALRVPDAESPILE